MINPVSAINDLPNEMLHQIFSHLPAPTLSKVSLICARWFIETATFISHLNMKTLLPDDRTLLPNVQIIDKSDWEKYAQWSIDDLPPLNWRTVIYELKNCCDLPVEGNDGITVLTIPKGLSFNKLQKLFPAKFSFVNELFKTMYGDVEVEHSYRLVITNGVLKGSRCKLVNEVQSYGGYTIPKVLEVAVLIIMTSLISNVYLFNRDSGTYTFCQEQTHAFGTTFKDDRMIVGCVSNPGIGLSVRDNCWGKDSQTGVALAHVL